MKNGTYDYDERLEWYRRIIKELKNAKLALKFLDHLSALGLSVARVSKYASHLPASLRVIDFNPINATRNDVEKVVAWINSQPYRKWTKHEKKLVLRKLIQYAKYGSCDRNAPLPQEVSWFSLRVKEKDSRVTLDSLLSKEEFEAALRPGELLTMTIGSVEFKDKYCLISVNGKTT